MMVGHVMLPRIDDKNLSSASKKIINDIIRKRWNHEGVLITDDLNMGAVYGSKLGIGNYSVQSMNAGMDLLLISYDGDQYYRAMYALLEAHKNGTLDREMLRNSAARLKKIPRSTSHRKLTGVTGFRD